jgi:transmembrane sensor
LSNVVKFSGSKQARQLANERAGEFLARLDAGATPEDLEQIRQWLAQNPLHQAAFVELAALWDQLTVLSTLSEVFPLDEYGPAAPGKPAQAPWRWAVAATVALTAGLLWFLREPVAEIPVFPDPEGFVQQFHETAVGQQATITLPDATEVILNTNTVVEVVYSKAGRNIFLTRGEAFFAVSKDPTRPFRVYAGNRLIEAVGTTFTVQHTRPDKVQVVVKEGKVNFLRMQAAIEPQRLLDNLDAVLYREENVPLSAGEIAASRNNPAFAVEKTQIQSGRADLFDQCGNGVTSARDHRLRFQSAGGAQRYGGEYGEEPPDRVCDTAVARTRYGLPGSTVGVVARARICDRSRRRLVVVRTGRSR